MKVLLFHVIKDEVDYIKECNQKFGFQITFAEVEFSKTSIDQFVGFDAVWITTNCKITNEKANELEKAGVRYIVSRAAGIDHIDIDSMKKVGMRGANVPRYSPNAIAEHTVCLILMCLRKMKREMKMIENHDFTLSGLKGKELRNMKVGVIGTGRIGVETIRCLSGFGSQIIAYDIYENPEVKDLVTYVKLRDVISDSDILVLHCPLTKENEKLISSDSIATMKDGVIVINTARGGLMDYDAVQKAIENGKISAAAFDVYDGEAAYIRKKVEPDQLESETLKKLIEKDNVIYTAHMSFYTDTAIENMIMTTFENLKEFDQTHRCSNEF